MFNKILLIFFFLEPHKYIFVENDIYLHYCPGGTEMFLICFWFLIWKKYRPYSLSGFSFEFFLSFLIWQLDARGIQLDVLGHHNSGYCFPQGNIYIYMYIWGKYYLNQMNWIHSFQIRWNISTNYAIHETSENKVKFNVLN